MMPCRDLTPDVGVRASQAVTDQGVTVRAHGPTDNDAQVVAVEQSEKDRCDHTDPRDDAYARQPKTREDAGSARNRKLPRIGSRCARSF
jgi:hypothetical protein